MVENGMRIRLELLSPRELARKVMATPINSRGLADKPRWPFTKNGEYTVKSGYQMAAEDQSINHSEPGSSTAGHELIWKKIWIAKVLPKIKSFVWRVCNNAIPTKENLCRRRVTQEANCPICHNEAETIEHLFLRCPWVRAVWFGSPFQWIVKEDNNGYLVGWLERKIAYLEESQPGRKGIVEGMFWLLWEIWRERNHYVFEGSKIDPVAVIDRAKRLGSEYSQAIEESDLPSTHSQLNNDSIQRWSPPPQGVFKANVDAATNLDLCRGAIAVVLRDSSGLLLSGFAKRIACGSAEQAEALAIREALRMINSLQLQNAIVESDNQSIVNGLNQGDWQWQISPILQECWEMISREEGISVKWVKRSANRVADLVSKLALNHALPLNWCWSPPVTIRTALLHDNLAI